jgi:hypothetical protein
VWGWELIATDPGKSQEGPVFLGSYFTVLRLWVLGRADHARGNYLEVGVAQPGTLALNFAVFSGV